MNNIVLRIIKDQLTWQAFVDSQAPHTFLQSWQWGDFNQRQGNAVTYYGIYRSDALIGVCLSITVKARRGSFMLVPHGPIMHASEALAALSEVLQQLVVCARDAGVDFLRICPLLPNTKEYTDIFAAVHFRSAPIHVHPELSWMLDITAAPDMLLAEMRKTTRYSIRKAEKDGVTIRQSAAASDIDAFYRVYQQTAQRQQFTAFSKKYLSDELAAFVDSDRIKMFIADYCDEPIAVAMIVISNGSAFYHHGASTQKFPKITASYLLQWQAIQYAQSRGCRYYNFWGISPADKPKHPWAGLSLFKQGFGGFSEAYVHAQDYPLKSKYWLNLAIEYARRIKRGL